MQLIHLSELYKMALGENLQKIRKDKGLKQEDLADKAGVSLTQISKIERNETDPRVSTIEKLSRVLGISVDKLIFGEEPESLDKMMQYSLERAMKLRPRDKATLINVINKYCSASILMGAFKSEMNIDFGIPEDSMDAWAEEAEERLIDKMVRDEETALKVEAEMQAIEEWEKNRKSR